MKKILIFFLLIAILFLVGIFFMLSRGKSFMPEESQKEKMLEGTKIVMVIAFRDFRDEEYFVTKDVLEKAGVEIKTASNKKGIAVGADGGEARVDFVVSEINPIDFDAVIFVGGPGCLEALDNQDSYHLIKEVVARDKILGSICISPVILAKAGVLRGKRATVWSSPVYQESIDILKRNGAIFESKPVVVDGKVITANGPAAAKNFGEKIIEALTHK